MFKNTGKVSGFYRIWIMSSFFYFINSCISLNSNFPEPLYLKDKFVIYLNSEDRKTNHKSDVLWNKLLGSIYIIDSPLFGKDKSPIFRESEINTLNTSLNQVFSQREGSITIIIITDDKVNPYLGFYRTVMKVYYSQEEVSLEFREIERHFLFDRGYALSDWARYEDKGVKCEHLRDILVDSKLKNKIKYIETGNCMKDRGILYKIFSANNKIKKKFGLKIQISDLDQVDWNRKNNENVEENSEIELKLEKLKSFYDKGLINKENYEEKKKQLLEDL